MKLHRSFFGFGILFCTLAITLSSSEGVGLCALLALLFFTLSGTDE